LFNTRDPRFIGLLLYRYFIGAKLTS